ncbi:DNA cytosine methyltransferase [Microbacterium sp. PMB16]|uniref:DNA cytosine methyltransferase n=1 Tax=Microbacterium sp. PMB16 TaxID=3120157 RepID=UPI003F4BC439
MTTLKAADLLIGAGGMAWGVERAGYSLAFGVDNDPAAIKTVAANRPEWLVLERDICAVTPNEIGELDLIVAGVPAPSQMQNADNSHNQVIKSCVELLAGARPRAVLLESTVSLRYASHRALLRWIQERLTDSGFQLDMRVLHASDLGATQRRPRLYIVGLQTAAFASFQWPLPSVRPKTLGTLLRDDMAANGWLGADRWAARANSLAPTIIGGSRRHGGLDLGPSGTKAAWWRLGVDPTSIADNAPNRDDPVELAPRLTLQMLARIQGMADWRIWGTKGQQGRLIASATPPIVAESLATSVAMALRDLMA